MKSQEEREDEILRCGVEAYQAWAEAIKAGDAGEQLCSSERLTADWWEKYRTAIGVQRRVWEKDRGWAKKIYEEYLSRAGSDLLAAIGIGITVSECLTPDDALEASVSERIGFAVQASVEGSRHARATKAELVQTGELLLSVLLEVATAPRSRIKAFKRSGRGVISLSSETATLIDEEHATKASLLFSPLPMVEKPRDWKSDVRAPKGGYHKLPIPFFRDTVAETQGERRPASYCRGINALNATRWRINDRILDVVTEIWNNGGKRGRIPEVISRGTFDAECAEAGDKEKKDLRARYAASEDFRHKLEIAREFSGEAFYLPQQLDFRGRVYAVPRLNHQGRDVCRGLLEFADAEPVTEEGLRWLKIHLAGCCGKGRKTFDERVSWVEDNAAVFAGWQRDPLKHTEWMTGWGDVEKGGLHHFQALAAGIALDDGEAGAHLPVHLDCSNLAFQHYAAMMRDGDTACFVNVLPGKPMDLYGVVGELMRVKSELAKQRVGQGGGALPVVRIQTTGSGETPEALEQAAQAYLRLPARDDALAGSFPRSFFRRSILKRSIIAAFYGLTEGGAKEQIAEALRRKRECSRRQARRVAKALAAEMFEVLRMFPGPVAAAKDWIRSCARIIADAHRPVCWTTPLGLEVRQPVSTTQIIKLGGKRQISVRDLRGKFPDPGAKRGSEAIRKAMEEQIDMAAANLIHSLDACHLLNTAIVCEREGVRIGSAHDCFAMHAAHATRVSQIVREEFRRLHEKPWLKELYRQFRDRYPDLADDFPEPPEAVDPTFPLHEVAASAYLVH